MIGEVEIHESRSHWTLMKNIEVKNNHNNYGKLKTFLLIFYFKRKIFPDGMLMKKIQTLCIWINSKIRSKLLVNLFYSGKLDKY